MVKNPQRQPAPRNWRMENAESDSFSTDGTGLTITEDGGDWVLKDDSGNVVFRYDEASGSWVMDSLSTNDANIGALSLTPLSDAVLTFSSGESKISILSVTSTKTVIATATPTPDNTNDVGATVDSIVYDNSDGVYRLDVSETEQAGGGDIRITIWEVGV